MTPAKGEARLWLPTGTLPGGGRVESLGGVPWHDCPVPPRWHRCRPQTRGRAGEGVRRVLIERCRCGATRLDGGPWFDRNQTRGVAAAARRRRARQARQ